MSRKRSPKQISEADQEENKCFQTTPRDLKILADTVIPEKQSRTQNSAGVTSQDVAQEIEELEEKVISELYNNFNIRRYNQDDLIDKNDTLSSKSKENSSMHSYSSKLIEKTHRILPDSLNHKVKKFRSDRSLGQLTQRFLELLPTFPVSGGKVELCLDEMAAAIQVERRRLYDVMNVMESIELVEKIQKGKYCWLGVDNLQDFLTRLKVVALRSNILATYRERTREGMQYLLANSNNTSTSNDLNLDKIIKSNSPSAKITGASGSSANSSASQNVERQSLTIMSQKFLMLCIMLHPERMPLEHGSWTLIGLPNEVDRSRAKYRRLYDIANVLRSLALVNKVNCPEQIMLCGQSYQMMGCRRPGFIYTGPTIPDQLLQSYLGHSDHFSPPISCIAEHSSSESGREDDLDCRLAGLILLSMKHKLQQESPGGAHPVADVSSTSSMPGQTLVDKKADAPLKKEPNLPSSRQASRSLVGSLKRKSCHDVAGAIGQCASDASAMRNVSFDESVLRRQSDDIRQSVHQLAAADEAFRDRTYSHLLSPTTELDDYKRKLRLNKENAQPVKWSGCGERDGVSPFVLLPGQGQGPGQRVRCAPAASRPRHSPDAPSPPPAAAAAIDQSPSAKLAARKIILINVHDARGGVRKMYSADVIRTAKLSGSSFSRFNSSDFIKAHIFKADSPIQTLPLVASGSNQIVSSALNAPVCLAAKSLTFKSEPLAATDSAAACERRVGSMEATNGSPSGQNVQNNERSSTSTQLINCIGGRVAVGEASPSTTATMSTSGTPNKLRS